MRTRTRAVALAAVGWWLGSGAGAWTSQPAFAGETLLACEYVGDLENLPPAGGGDISRPRPGRARFAGSNHTIAEGPVAGSGGRDFPGVPVPRVGFALEPECVCSTSGQPDPFSEGGFLEERFTGQNLLFVPGPDGVSPNGERFFQNLPSCVDVGQVGVPALFQWTVGLETTVVSDIRVEICLDIRKCQPEEDALGQAMTVPIPDFEDRFGVHEPPSVRVIHHRGALWGTPPGSSRCACEDRTLAIRRMPGPVPGHRGAPPWVPLRNAPETLLESSVAFIGKDCLGVTVKNDHGIFVRDFLTIELFVPATTRVRIRAASDAAVACYVGGVLPGQQRD